VTIATAILFAFLFETPLAAAAVAAGAASIPILIHLFNRRRYQVVTWAAMRFLLAAQRKYIRRMRIEQVILLAVRTAIVVLLVAAMASVMPWADELWIRLFPGSTLFAAAAGRRTHKVLVIDGSLSMAAKVEDSTCFERARMLAQRVVAESSTGDGLSVVLAAAPPRPIVGGTSEAGTKVADEIAGLALPEGNSDLAATFTTVESLLKQSPAKYEEREVYFFTDLQRATWAATKSGETAEQLRRIQAHARTIIVDVGWDIPFNSAVTSVQPAAPFVMAGTATPLTATIQHYGQPRRQVRAELLVGKARLIANDPPLALRPVQQTLVDLVPGANAINFVHKFPSVGEYAVAVRIEGDHLTPDDSRAIVLSVKDSLQVMLVNGKPAAEPYDRATEWLLDALNPYPNETAPRNVIARPKVVTEAEFADAALGDLSRYECVFLCDVAQLTGGEIHRLETHLRRGGGIVFCLGAHVDLEAYNRLLYRDGDGILPARLVGRERTAAKEFFNLSADEAAFRGPPLAAFTSEQDRASLFSARFREYIRADPTPRGQPRLVLTFRPETSQSKDGESSQVPSERARAREDAPRSQGSKAALPALVDWPRHRGRVLLYTSTANMDWTTWPASPSYPALMQEILHYSAAGRTREQASTVGEVLEAFVDAGGPGLPVSVRLPSGLTEETRTEPGEDSSVIRWSETDQSGIYIATVGQHPREYPFAVNVPAASENQQASESDPTRINESELKSLYPDWEFQLVADPHQVNHSSAPGNEPVTGARQSAMGMVMGRYLLFAMFLLLVLEVVLAWWFGHYSAVQVAQGSASSAGRLAVPVIAGLASLAFMIVSGVLVHAVWSGDFLGFLPDNFRSAMEARLGIPPPASGEGTRWYLEFTPYIKDAVADPWLAGTCGLAVAFAVIAIYLREGQTANRGYKLLLAGLRLFVIFVTLAVLLPELQLRFEREGWPDVAILIDDSRSMSVSDRYEDASAKAIAERLVQDLPYLPPERLRLVQAILTGRQGGWLEDLLVRRRVRIHLYHCASQAGHLCDVSEPRQLDEAMQSLRQLRAEGDSSRLGAAVRQVINDYRGSTLAALIMMTDGVTTEGEDLVKVSQYAARSGVPLFLVGLGDSREARDLKLHDLQVEDTVNANDRLVFEGRLAAHGFSEPRNVTIALAEKDSEGKLNPLTRENVAIDPQGKPVKFRLIHQPTEPGEKCYVIHMLLSEEEARAIDSNRLERTVLVREAKVIRVLYVEGSARYEYRFIKNLLERESQSDKRNKSIDLRVLLLDADSEYPSEDKSALADFPTVEELNQYDVVLLGDVDPKDKRLGDKCLRALADFVKQRGGGLLMIAGPRFSPQAYQDSPLAGVLPIEVRRAPPSEPEYTSAYRPELTAVGRFHPIFRFSPDESENAAIWNRLTGMYWWSEEYGIKPAAEVLLIHPRRAAADPDSRRLAGGGESGYPLAVQQFVGAGRCMFFGFEETWRWRYRNDEPRFNQFWLQTVRYLARSRLGRVALRVDRQGPYRRGEPIKITVRFPDDMPPPGPDIKVEISATRKPITRSQDSAQIETLTLRLEKLEGSRAIYEGQLNRTPEGEYHFALTAPAVSEPKPQAEAQVLPPPGEMEQLRMNRPDMERAAEATHGRFYTLTNVNQVVDDLPVGSRLSHHVPQPPRLLWNHFVIFGLIIGLLTAEWALRKRRYLL
jgi:hypothetical protein